MASLLSRIIDRFGRRSVDKIDQVVRDQSSLLRDDIVRGWPVDTGQSRAAWQGPTKVEDRHYKVTNNVVYAAVIEYGGYPGVGPKTERRAATTLKGNVHVNRGIYPTQRPHAPVRRALSKRKLEMKKALEKATKA